MGLIPVSGWVAGVKSGASVEIEIDGVAAELLFDRVRRPDVAKVFPDLEMPDRPGFVGDLNTTKMANGRYEISCVASAGDGKQTIGRVEVVVSNGPGFEFYERTFFTAQQEAKRRKLDALLRILQCPSCRSELVRRADRLGCLGCEKSYPLVDEVPVMIDGAPRYPVLEDALETPASRHHYPLPVLSRLEATAAKGGLALDVGSGRRSFGADALVQLEICRYPFTDVINQTEELPFRDGSFDFVVSLAVTEHVRRPWVLAQEILRVLKPGGDLVVDCAFLTPLHGYPDHYFNMSHLALRDLFSGVEIESLAPAPYQHPWFALRWMLQSILAGLEEADRSRLHSMRLDAFLAALDQRCTLRPSELSSMELPTRVMEEVGTGFTLVGKKPE